MSTSDRPRILVTGATGQLGRLVIDELLKSVPAGQIAATVRDTEAATHVTSRAIQTRINDYRDPVSLDAALTGIERLLFISSNAIGERVGQHRNMVEAAARAGVRLLAYTSVLHADRSALGLAADHRETERMLRASGVPIVLLRNGWYTENYLAFASAALARGALLGAAGDGRIASAARADYAAAAASVLTDELNLAGRTFELAGDDSYTLADLAAELSRQSGRDVAYRNLPEAELKSALLGAGLPDDLASLLADSDAAAAHGALFDDGRDLGRLLGRPTTPMATSLAQALQPR